MSSIGSVLWPALAVAGCLAAVSVALAALLAFAPRLTVRPLRKDLELLASGTDGNVSTAA
jgi:hypothetical protein